MGLTKAIYNGKELELCTREYNEERKMKRGREREIDSENEKELMNYGNLLDTLYFLVNHFFLAFIDLR